MKDQRSLIDRGPSYGVAQQAIAERRAAQTELGKFVTARHNFHEAVSPYTLQSNQSPNPISSISPMVRAAFTRGFAP